METQGVVSARMLVVGILAGSVCILGGVLGSAASASAQGKRPPSPRAASSVSAPCAFQRVPNYRAGVYSIEDVEWLSRTGEWSKSLWMISEMPQMPEKGLTLRRIAEPLLSARNEDKEARMKKAACVTAAARSIPKGGTGRDAAAPLLVQVYLEANQSGPAQALLQEIERPEAAFAALGIFTDWAEGKKRFAEAKSYAVKAWALVAADPHLFRSEPPLYALQRSFERLGDKQRAAKVAKRIEAIRPGHPPLSPQSTPQIPADEAQQIRAYLSGATGFRFLETGRLTPPAAFGEQRWDAIVQAAVGIGEPEERFAALTAILSAASKRPLEPGAAWFSELLRACENSAESPHAMACRTKAAEMLARALWFEQSAELIRTLPDEKLGLRAGGTLLSESYLRGTEEKYLPLLDSRLAALAAAPELPSKWESEGEAARAFAAIGRKERGLQISAQITDAPAQERVRQDIESASPLLRLQTPVPIASPKTLD